jgi:hypothetical protein
LVHGISFASGNNAKRPQPVSAHCGRALLPAKPRENGRIIAPIIVGWASAHQIHSGRTPPSSRQRHDIPCFVGNPHLRAKEKSSFLKKEAKNF